MRSIRFTAVLLAAALLPAPFAAARQATFADPLPVDDSSFRYVVLPGAAPAGERTARQNQPLLVQRAVSPWAAQLVDAVDVPSFPAGGPPAGSRMFGVRYGLSIVYCAVKDRSDWWREPYFLCLYDRDEDGRFDEIMPTGEQGLDVPFFTLDYGAMRKLAKPAAYRRLPYAEGPAMNFSVIWSPPDAAGRKPDPKLKTPPLVDIGLAFETRKGLQPMITPRALMAAPDQPDEVAPRGSRIRLLGYAPDGALRYQVLAPMNPHMDEARLVASDADEPRPRKP